MSESKSVRWLCHRCIKKESADVDPDPVLLRVCDGCQVENYTRPVKGTVIVAEDVEVVGEVVVESVIEEVAPEPEPEPEDPKKAEIEALKAKLAELEK